MDTSIENAALATRPDHVPPHLVLDFDCYNIGGSFDDLQVAWLALKEKAPSGIFWTPRNRGHWVVLNGADIEKVYSDYSRFSSEDIFIPPNGSRGNALIPQEMNPPASLAYRSVMLRPLMPANLGHLEGQVRKRAAHLVEKLLPQGECEFVEDFATVLPVEIFLDLMGLPPEDRSTLMPLGKMSTRPESPEQRAWAHGEIRQYLSTWIDKRRAEPGEDLLSRLALASISGQEITKDEALRFSLNILLGGLDTVANLLAFCALFLARHPAQRRQLIERPELLKPATEELIRRYGMVAVGRRVATDTELCGVQLRHGDMVQGPTMLYGMDDSIVSDPLMVDFERKSCPHMTFGSGPHICPGQHLARKEVQIFMEEWLKSIPDFSVRPGASLEIETGLVGGLISLNLIWNTNGA
ncbi:cytochrome P450 [Massilia niabensis]|uniref:Cytochrome P450 n=1 Tax=Massilia niabensis TaxID=544910 RepID=A0ABW0LB37_9BURK